MVPARFLKMKQGMKNIAMDHCVSHSHGDFLPITKTARTTKRDAKRGGRASRYLVALLIVFPCFQFVFSFCYIIHSYAHGSLLRVHISTSSIYSLSHLFQRSIHQTLHQNDKIPCVRSFIRFETSTGNREKLSDF